MRGCWTEEARSVRGTGSTQAGYYWIIESRLRHPLDVSLKEDRSRVRHPNAALVLGMVRRVVASCALAWLAAVQTRQTRFSVRLFQKQFVRRDSGSERLNAFVFAKSPTAWRLAK